MFFHQAVGPWALSCSCQNLDVTLVAHVYELSIVKLTPVIYKDLFRGTKYANPGIKSLGDNLICTLIFHNGSLAVPSSMIYNVQYLDSRSYILKVHCNSLIEAFGKRK